MTGLSRTDHCKRIVNRHIIIQESFDGGKNESPRPHSHER
jgi:hypothetical protein